MNSRFLWKLWSINALTILLAFFIVWMAIDYFAADYFMVLMDKYNVSPKDVHTMFLEATHRALIAAVAGALMLAGLLSFLLTKRVLEPLTQMGRSAKRIMAGDYTTRVRVSSHDEVGRLGEAFNQMSASLERVDTLRKKIVIDIAHELRTPLTNIRGYLEALTSGVVSPSRATFVSLHEETLRLNDLAEQLLQLARADAASMNLQRTPVVIPHVIDQALELFKVDFQSRKIHVEKELNAIHEPIQADSDKLMQVIRNLLANASQYTPEGGTLRITADRTGSAPRIVFTNGGEPIDEQDLPYIFERFYRGEKSRSREYGGAGIGLAIVKELVEAHGGKVGAESNTEETRIWFSLPG
jgi:two-component system, OmpR family, sensor histidine kinase BaeS